MWTPCCVQPFIYLSVWHSKLVPQLLCRCPHSDWIHHITSYPIATADVIVLLDNKRPNASSCQIPACGKACRASADNNNVRICILSHCFTEHFCNGSCDFFLAHVGKYLCHMRYHPPPMVINRLSASQFCRQNCVCLRDLTVWASS